ncbi:MAG: sulfotransferase [Gammaproteobacteria bacterium]|nr:sulfotransferase [Gammaproteobacteria bacterium]
MKSGSAILNAHENICIPHPPHIMNELAHRVPKYGDLSQEPNFRKLIDHAVRVVELHFAPWDVVIDRELVFKEAVGRDLYSIKRAIYEQYMRAKGKTRWGCKSTFMIHHTDLVRKYHKTPKFIHLVRDGRDVAVSARDSVFNHFHPYYVAQLWAHQQQLAIKLSRELPADQFMTVHYENLTATPEHEVRRICAFIGENYMEQMLNYASRPDSVRLAGISKSWENISKPILANNTKKYRTKLTAEEIFVVERNTLQELQYFGYTLENDLDTLQRSAAAPLPASQRLKYFLLEKTSAISTGLIAMVSDKNAYLRLKKRFFIRAACAGL